MIDEGHQGVYVRRRGRMTRGQDRAFRELASEYVLTYEELPEDWAAWFGRTAPLGVEVGFGMGQALIDWAESAPDMNLIGIEVYVPGIGSLLREMQARELTNLRVIDANAEQVFATAIKDASLTEVRVFFPDPWPKKRHHKRRLIHPGFVHRVGQCLVPDGQLLMATDWASYAEQMLEVGDAESLLENCHGGFAPRAVRPTTRFEARGHRHGHEVWDLAYRRRAG